MRELLFVTDVSQLNAALARIAAHPETQLVTGDMAVSAALEDLGVGFVDEWGLLSVEELVANWKRTVEFSRDWWDARWGNVELCERSFPEVAQQEWMWPIETCLNANQAYGRLLAGEPVGHVYGYFLPPTPIYRALPAPVFRAASSLAHSVLFWECERQGVPVTGLAVRRSLAREARRAHGRLAPLEARPEPRSAPAERTLVLLECGMRAAEVGKLEAWFARQAGWRVVRLSPNHLEFPLLGARPFLDGNATDQLERCWRSFRVLRSERLPAVFANSHLDFQVRRIWDELARAARLAGAFGAVLDVLRPSLVVLGHEAYALERSLVRMAHRRGIPTASLIHTGLRHATGYWALSGEAERLLVWSEVDVHHLTRSGVAADRMARVGSLQFHDRLKPGVTGLRHAGRSEARVRLGLRPDAPLVLLASTAISAGFTIPIAHPGELRRAWRELVKMARRRPELTFAIKPHPSYDYYVFYRHLCQSGPSNLRFLEAAELSEALPAADVLVLFNYCSTAALEAMIERVPVIFLRNALVDIPEQEDSLGGRGVVTAASTAELEEAIDGLLGNAIAREELQRRADEVLTDFIGDPAVPAIERVAEALTSCAGVSESTNGARAPRGQPAQSAGATPVPPSCDAATSSAEHGMEAWLGAAILAGATGAPLVADGGVARSAMLLAENLAALATATDRKQRGLARRLALYALVRFPAAWARRPPLLHRLVASVVLNGRAGLAARRLLGRLGELMPARYRRVRIPGGRGEIEAK